MEDPIPNADHLPLTDDTVTVPIKPYEILTLQVTYPDKTAPCNNPTTTKTISYHEGNLRPRSTCMRRIALLAVCFIPATALAQVPQLISPDQARQLVITPAVPMCRRLRPSLTCMETSRCKSSSILKAAHATDGAKWLGRTP